MKRFALCLVFLAVFFGSTHTAFSTPMPLDGSWIVLDEFMNEGDFFSGGPWTWDSTSCVVFTVTDLYVLVNYFGIYDNGVHVLDTPTLPDYVDYGWGAYDHWVTDPDVALVDPLYSHAVIKFAPGAHSISIKELHLPAGFSDGTVAFKAEVGIPEPSTILLIGTGLVGLSGYVLRRRKKRV